MLRFTLALLAAATTAQAAAVFAQSTPVPASRATEYRSPFADYRPFKNQAVAPWRDVNREVGQVGGHAGSLKSRSDAAPQAASSSQGKESQNTPTPPSGTDHAAHH